MYAEFRSKMMFHSEFRSCIFLNSATVLIIRFRIPPSDKAHSKFRPSDKAHSAIPPSWTPPPPLIGTNIGQTPNVDENWSGKTGYGMLGKSTKSNEKLKRCAAFTLTLCSKNPAETLTPPLYHNLLSFLWNNENLRRVCIALVGL